MYLTKCALHTPQEVIVSSPNAVSAVNVIHFKSQLLNFFKVIVQRENLAKHRVQVALDHFCPVQLQ